MDEESIFAAAVEQPSPAECAAFLDRACMGDVNLRARVERLLAAHRRPDPFLDAPDTRLIVNATLGLVRESAGSTIGPYKLIEQIGEGGMGLVFLAQQHEPVRRIVALKIIKPGMDSRQVVKRFESERQALALMEHPHIAKVLDVGTTESGHPYFVMELVRGIAITEYCDQAKLNQRERLELFINVCHAVQHAHQKGIIHRDLKPANVLVTMHDDVAIPKVIDFGVAKAIDQTAADQTQVTNFAQMIGTPTYMSPEQAQMSCLDVDTRSDVYSLGVLLYELLTGTTPFEKGRLRAAGYDEMRRILREEEPPPPSSRVATLAAGPLSTTVENRGVDPRRFGQILRGDLDWIVMKALEKDRTRRYESASALAADVRRFLADEPIEARPPTATYRLRKFARRNKRLVGLASLLVGFLLTSLIGLGAAYLLISKEHKETVRQQNISRENEAKVIERESTIRKFLYAADVQLAWAAYSMGDGKHAREKLLSHVPATGSVDNRGFEWHYLLNLIEDHSRVLRAQHRDVFGAEFSPDGQRLATTSADRTVVVWKVSDGTPLITLRDFTDDVNRACFSRDGNLLATAEEAGIARLWDLQTGREVARWTGFEFPVAQVYLTADGLSLVATDVNWETHQAHLSVWDLASQKQRKFVEGHRMLAVDPSRNLLAAVRDDGDLCLWTVPELDLLSRWTGPAEQVLCAAFSPDGAALATGCRNGTVDLWNLADRSRRKLAATHSQAVRSVAFSHDGRLVFAVGDDGAARVWDSAGGTLQKVLPSAHGRRWSVAISPDGSTLAIGCGDGSVELRDTSALRLLQRRIPTSTQFHSGIALNPAGTSLAVIDSDTRYVSILDVESGNRLKRILVPDDRVATALAYAPEEGSLWIGTNYGEAYRLDTATGTAKLAFRPHHNWIESLHVSPSGRLLASNTRDDDWSSRIWDTKTGRELLTLNNSPYLEFNRPNSIRGFFGESRAITSRRETVVLWNVESGRDSWPMFPHEGFVHGAALSPDGKTLATGTADRLIHCWDVAGGREFATLRGHRNPLRVLAFSPDGRTLASGSDGDEIKLWHLPTTQFLYDLKGHTATIRFLAFTPDGRRLITADQANTILVWDGRPEHRGLAPQNSKFASENLIK